MTALCARLRRRLPAKIAVLHCLRGRSIGLVMAIVAKDGVVRPGAPQLSRQKGGFTNEFGHYIGVWALRMNLGVTYEFGFTLDLKWRSIGLEMAAKAKDGVVRPGALNFPPKRLWRGIRFKGGVSS